MFYSFIPHCSIDNAQFPSVTTIVPVIVRFYCICLTDMPIVTPWLCSLFSCVRRFKDLMFFNVYLNMPFPLTKGYLISFLTSCPSLWVYVGLCTLEKASVE
jgi:hypothetical protein